MLSILVVWRRSESPDTGGFERKALICEQWQKNIPTKSQQIIHRRENEKYALASKKIQFQIEFKILL